MSCCLNFKPKPIPLHFVVELRWGKDIEAASAQKIFTCVEPQPITLVFVMVRLMIWWLVGCCGRWSSSSLIGRPAYSCSYLAVVDSTKRGACCWCKPITVCWCWLLLLLLLLLLLCMLKRTYSFLKQTLLQKDNTNKPQNQAEQHSWPRNKHSSLRLLLYYYYYANIAAATAISKGQQEPLLQ